MHDEKVHLINDHFTSIMGRLAQENVSLIGKLWESVRWSCATLPNPSHKRRYAKLLSKLPIDKMLGLGGFMVNFYKSC